MEYFTIALLVLALLQVKHWFVDFVNQTDEEVAHKGIYLDWRGVKHSLKHSVVTFLVLPLITSYETALVLACLDFILHYHIDWIKMKFGNRDIKSPAFWNHLGLDQMAHQLTYIFIIFMVV